MFNFRGVIFDVDPVFANTEEWWQAIPAEVRPHKDQPFYHLLAENDEGGYVAYVSEQNLLPDTSGEPVGNPNTSLIFDGFRQGPVPPAPAHHALSRGRSVSRPRPSPLRPRARRASVH